MIAIAIAPPISHHGIQGQKWGIRRFTNPDGSLTAEGKKRYGKDNAKNRRLALAREEKEKSVIADAKSTSALSAIGLGTIGGILGSIGALFIGDKIGGADGVSKLLGPMALGSAAVGSLLGGILGKTKIDDAYMNKAMSSYNADEKLVKEGKLPIEHLIGKGKNVDPAPVINVYGGYRRYRYGNNSAYYPPVGY